MPLPPYIVEALKEKDRYQTVYAYKRGVCCCTYSRTSFYKRVIRKNRKKGIKIIIKFLEVGLGTFRPVQTEDVLDHKMHEETYEIPQEAADIINEGKRNGKRIISVGTTSTRALESAVDENGLVKATKGSTDIFIYPGYKFKVKMLLLQTSIYQNLLYLCLYLHSLQESLC